MEIIRQGKDVSEVMICKVCGCVFSYLPGDLVKEHCEIYDVPEVHRRRYGGDHDPVRIDIRSIIRCPNCKSKYVIKKDGHA